MTADGALDPAAENRPQGVVGDRFEGRPQGWLLTRYWPGASLPHKCYEVCILL